MLDHAIAAAAGPFSGVFACHAENLATGETAGFDADRLLPAASTIKVGVMAATYAAIEAGEIDPEERITVGAEHWRPGSGVLKELAPGLAPTIEDLIRLMTVVSDNVATLILVERLGISRINAALRAWGLEQTTLVWDLDKGPRDYAVATPRELARLMALIATDAIVSPAACAAMRNHLARQQYRDQIGRYLPFHPYWGDPNRPQPVALMNKTGFQPGIRADAAIVAAAGTTFVLATMTENSRDRGFAPEQEGAVLNGRVARLVFDAWVGTLDHDETWPEVGGPKMPS